MRQLTWKNVFITMLGASLVSIAGFYATGMGGFAAVASAIVIVLMLLAAWVWTIQILVVVGKRRLVAGPTPLQRAAGFATWIAGNGAWVAFAALTGSLYLGAQFGVFLLLSGVGLRTNLKELVEG